MNKKYYVKLSKEQQQHLEKLISSGTTPARTITRAHILLKSDCSKGAPNWTYRQITDAYNVSDVTIAKVRKTFVEEGFEAALYRKKPDRVYKRRLDGEGEAHLIALACSEAPQGYERWTLSLLKDRLIRLKIVDNISPETIRKTLKKTSSNLG